MRPLDALARLVMQHRFHAALDNLNPLHFLFQPVKLPIQTISLGGQLCGFGLPRANRNFIVAVQVRFQITVGGFIMCDLGAVVLAKLILIFWFTSLYR